MLRNVRSLLVLIILVFTALPAARADEAGQQPKAADLVKDGQLINLATPRYQDLFKELRSRYDFSQEEIDRLFAGVTIKQRVLELMDTQWEAKPYYLYYPLFITPEVVAEGREKLAANKELLDKIEKEIGVEREIVVAIWGVETRYGQHKGAFNLFQTLNTMFDAYPRRSNFYREQLVHFLLLCRENHVDPQTVTGSYGGAFGQTQFIPSSFRDYALDFDKDGSRDVWNSTSDVLASIANYLHRFGWVFHAPIYHEIGPVLKSETLEKAYKTGRKGFVSVAEVAQAQGVTVPPAPDNKQVTIVGLELEDGGMRYVAGYPNFQAITAWNNSNRYAMAVAELAEKLAGK
ncbi:MAG: lytic murein transglycosylase [Proteobacteria bacterium]|nr:lytic murein transglycosylase [Pseudomonadota bacterium]MBU4296847.1 lytic murein transglycosylase [Pseudomonadota bacterium]MCG2748973.1 lytic murein transglycosylase [Desulfobulbaceae bacterium]